LLHDWPYPICRRAPYLLMRQLNYRSSQMPSAPIPVDEEKRLASLKRYRILDTSPEDAFDRITRIVAETIGVPIALVSLVDRERQWFKSRYGLEAEETPRELAFCAHAILQDGVMVVEDASNDPRFSDNPLVTNDPSIRFYAGAPLTAPNGQNLGTLCAIDKVPRQLTLKQSQLLQDLSSVIVDELELRLALQQSANEIAEAARQDAMKDEFLSTVTHELRTPLTSIKGSLGLLHGGAVERESAAAADLIERANRNAEDLGRLIDDLLDFQKYQSGNLELEFAEFDPAGLVSETCDKMKSYAERQNTRISVQLGSSKKLLGDSARLSQVLTNLISNAVKFAPEDTEVVVRAEQRQNILQLSVSDRGPGIPKSFRHRVFEKFAQASTPERPNGTGLGLAISKAIVEGHGGKIYFESSADAGTTFFVELPIRHSFAL
jgi:two-component system, sensor histidine kinase